MNIYKSYGPYNQYEPYEDVIYRLTAFHASNVDEATYPRFDVRQSEESIHRSFEDAYKRMRRIIEDKMNLGYRWQRFIISEVPVGVNCNCQLEGQRCRTYDLEGNLVHETKVSDIPDRNNGREIYWGREADECRFKVGDIVEVTWDDSVELHMIWKIPFDEAYARTRMPKEKPDEELCFHLDDTDDCYVTVNLTDDFPDHVYVSSCFPAKTLRMDESIVRQLQKVFDRCNEEYKDK